MCENFPSTSFYDFFLFLFLIMNGNLIEIFLPGSLPTNKKGIKKTYKYMQYDEWAGMILKSLGKVPSPAESAGVLMGYS